MVCTANLCRSPIAQFVTVQMAEQANLRKKYLVESAGVNAGRVRNPLDSRAKTALTRRGYVVGKFKSRLIAAQDFERFDLILAMDNANMTSLKVLCPPEHAHKLRYFLDFAPELAEKEVPDPYYGSPQGFERVVDLCEAAGRGLVRHMQAAL